MRQRCFMLQPAGQCFRLPVKFPMNTSCQMRKVTATKTQLLIPQYCTPGGASTRKQISACQPERSQACLLLIWMCRKATTTYQNSKTAMPRCHKPDGHEPQTADSTTIFSIPKMANDIPVRLDSQA